MKRGPRFSLCAAVIVVLVGGLPAIAQQQVKVELKSGRIVSGELVEQNAERVVIKVGDNPAVTFARELVKAVTVQKNLTADFAAERAKIKDDEYNGRYLLCRRFMLLGDQAGKTTPKAAKAYSLALGEINKVLEAQPNNLPSKLLRDALTARLKAAEKAGALKPKEPVKDPEDPKQPVDPKNPKDPKNPTKPHQAGDSDVLTPEQINLLWVYETNIDRRKPPTVKKLKNDVIDKIFEDARFRADPALQQYLGKSGLSRFKRLKGWAQLQVLFDLRARDLYGEVEVPEPAQLKEFATKIYPRHVATYCGACHMARGPKKTPEALKAMYLVSRVSHPKITKAQEIYTNYMILTRTNVGGFKVIDRGAPEKSHLWTYGLPQDDVVTRHPALKPGLMKPVFRNTSDRNYKAWSAWTHTLYKQDYPIVYTPPAERGKAKAPAAEAAVAPAPAGAN